MVSRKDLERSVREIGDVSDPTLNEYSDLRAERIEHAERAQRALVRLKTPVLLLNILAFCALSLPFGLLLGFYEPDSAPELREVLTAIPFALMGYVSGRFWTAVIDWMCSILELQIDE